MSVEGNKNAEKWTREAAFLFWERALSLVKNDPEIIYLGDLAVEMDTYKDVFAYLEDKFRDDSTVFRTVKKVHTILEQRLFKGSLKGQFKEATAIFGLKHNHNWTDKVLNINVEKPIDEMTEEEIDAALHEFE